MFEKIDQREYFSFYDYEYMLDVTRQNKLISETTPFKEGLMECYKWYVEHKEEVRRKPFIEFIDTNLSKRVH